MEVKSLEVLILLQEKVCLISFCLPSKETWLKNNPPLLMQEDLEPSYSLDTFLHSYGPLKRFTANQWHHFLKIWDPLPPSKTSFFANHKICYFSREV